MSLNFYTPPEIEEIIARIKTYIKGELDELNPTDQNNLIFSLIVAMANLSNDNNKQILLDILPNVFPQYCKSVESLENFADWKNITRNPATGSKGKATISGIDGSVIELGQVFIANNKEYKNLGSIEITTQEIVLNSLTVNGTLVKAVTASNHNFASNINVTISGAENKKLNGEYPITVTGLKEFTYVISESITAEETENLIAKANIAVLQLECLSTGADTNLSNGDALAISEPIEGVSSNAYTQFSGISGGADIQSFDEWKAKVVDRFQNPITYFNENNIRQTALSVSGVTKVWVYPCTPTKGQVTVFFIRGNDEDVIPDVNEVKEVTDKILALRNVKDDPSDVFVYAPTPKKIDFTFSSITPDTPTMKTAIKNALKQLFEDEVELGVSMTQRNYENAIGNCYDMETGTKLKNYTLDNPTGDIEVATNELLVLGDVTFL